MSTLVDVVGRDAAAKAFGITERTIRRYFAGQPSRRIDGYVSARFGDDPNALRQAIIDLESPWFADPHLEAQVPEQPQRSGYMPLSLPQPDSSDGTDMRQGSSRTLTVEPRPQEPRLPPPIPALVAEWRQILPHDADSNLESRKKKERIAALRIRERRLNLEVLLIGEHGMSLAGSPDVHWDELRRREECGWRVRELADVRERLRKLERFSEVFSWLRSPFSAR